MLMSMVEEHNQVEERLDGCTKESRKLLAEKSFGPELDTLIIKEKNLVE